MAGVTATIALSLSARLTGAAIGADTPQFNASVAKSLSFEPGTDAVDKADLLYRATRTLAASANEDLDLAGVLANALGATFTAAEVVAVLIEADKANTNDVKYGPAAANGALLGFNAAADKRSVAPGDFDLQTCRRGWPVTGGTGDKINVANAAAGTPVTYTITVIGRTVAA